MCFLFVGTAPALSSGGLAEHPPTVEKQACLGKTNDSDLTHPPWPTVRLVSPQTILLDAGCIVH